MIAKTTFQLLRDWGAKMGIWAFAWETVLILVIIVLLVNFRRCQAADSPLNKGGEEQTALYKELAASHEELQYRYAELMNMQEKLRKSDERCKLIMDGANDGLWDYDVIKDELYLSERSAEILHLPAGEFGSLEKYFDKVLFPEDREKIEAMRRDQAEGKKPYFIYEHRVKTAPGTWVLVRSQRLLDEEGNPVRIAGSHTDITEMKAAEEELRCQNEELTALNEELTASQEKLTASYEELSALNEELTASYEKLQLQYIELTATQEKLRESEERYKLALAGANDGIWDYDVIKDEIYMSERSADILSLPAGQIGSLKNYFDMVVFQEDRERVEALRRDHIEGKTPYFICEHRLKTNPGTWVLVRAQLLRDETGNPVRFAGSHTDITAVKKNQDMISYQAFHDALTGLPNRAALSVRVAAMAAQCAADNCSGAILLIDLDNFKGINDTFGHICGDQILVLVSERISRLGSGKHFVARPGGDEFSILLENIASRAEAAEYAEAMFQAFEEPLWVEDKVFHITISAGITLCPQDGQTAEELFKHADLALYSAKAQGKNRYVHFSRSMDELARKKLLMERNLRDALVNNEFRLFYQPQIGLTDGRITGFEALIRWYSKDYGLVMPLDFIRLAEETGLIVPIGRWVLKTACEFLAGLIRDGYHDLRVSVNLSVMELYQGDFVESVQQIVAATGVPPGNIAMEITESVLMESIESNILKLAEIRRYGITIYLDDFGTGYSSLKYLKDLPIDGVKIDKSFIDYMDNEGVEKELTGAIVELAHRIGLQTVAEGIETQGQLEKLRNYQCDVSQGYFFSKPVPVNQIYSLLQKFR